MSEFLCINGHLMRSRDRFCTECGEPCYTMDGKTGRQLAAEMEPEPEIELEDGIGDEIENEEEEP